MIGINFFIIMAAALLFMRYHPQASALSIRWGVRLVNNSLAMLWAGLAVPSLIEGFQRTQHSYQSYQNLVEPWLWVFPVLGFFLFSGIFVLVSEVIWLPLKRNLRRSSASTVESLSRDSLPEN